MNYVNAEELKKEVIASREQGAATARLLEFVVLIVEHQFRTRRDVDDLTQEVVIFIMAKYTNIDPEMNPFAYLSQIARNKHLRLLRVEKQHKAVEQTRVELGEGLPTTPYFTSSKDTQAQPYLAEHLGSIQEKFAYLAEGKADAGAVGQAVSDLKELKMTDDFISQLVPGYSSGTPARPSPVATPTPGRKRGRPRKVPPKGLNTI